MTTPVITVPEEAMATRPLRLMLEHGIHHLPVARSDGRVVGVVTDTDLIGLERSVPFTFLRALDRAETTDEVVARMSELRTIVPSWWRWRRTPWTSGTSSPARSTPRPVV